MAGYVVSKVVKVAFFVWLTCLKIDFFSFNCVAYFFVMTKLSCVNFASHRLMVLSARSMIISICVPGNSLLPLNTQELVMVYTPCIPKAAFTCLYMHHADIFKSIAAPCCKAAALRKALPGTFSIYFIWFYEL